MWKSFFPQQAEHQNSFGAHWSGSFSCKIKNRRAGMWPGGGEYRTREERTRGKEGTAGCAGKQKEGDRDEAPCVAAAEQDAESQLQSINQNRDLENVRSKVINVNFLKSWWKCFFLQNAKSTEEEISCWDGCHPAHQSASGGDTGRGVGNEGSRYSSAFPQANLGPNCRCVTLGTLTTSHCTFPAECP